MAESLGSRPEELYAEHKSTAERLDEMQKRLDAARVLSDILTPEQISQLGSADFDAKMQHENNLKEAARHYQENQDTYVEQAKEEMQAKDMERLGNAIEQINDQWRGYKLPENSDWNLNLRPLDFNFVNETTGLVKELSKLDLSTWEELAHRPAAVSLAGLTAEQRNAVRRQLPNINIVPEDEEISQNPH